MKGAIRYNTIMDETMSNLMIQAEIQAQETEAYYRVKYTVMARKDWGTKWTLGFVAAGTIIPIDALQRDGWILAIEPNKWIPMTAVEKVYPDLPPVIVDEFEPVYGAVKYDHEQRWPDGKSYISRPTRTNSPRSVKGLPATARFVVDTLVNMTPDIQIWMHRLSCEAAGLDPESAEAKNSWRGLMQGNRFITNKMGSDTHADYVNWRNIGKDNMKLQPMACGAAVLRIVGRAVIKGEACYKFEAINSLGNYRQYHPSTHPHLFYNPTNSVRAEILNKRGKWDGTWNERISEAFHWYDGHSVIPIFAVDSDYNYIQTWRVRLLADGEAWPEENFR